MSTVFANVRQKNKIFFENDKQKKEQKDAIQQDDEKSHTNNARS